MSNLSSNGFFWRNFGGNGKNGNDSKEISSNNNDQESKKWLFTLRRPKSQRFSQLSFKGFGPIRQNKFKYFFDLLLQFIRAVFKYFVKKIKRLVFGVKGFVLGFKATLTKIKSWLIQKLIWSRGKLGRPIATLFVMLVALVVFTFGEVLNSSRFVNSQELNPDYLSNVSDIIPQRDLATTTIPDDRRRNVAFTYTIKPGDTISGIGAKFRISEDALQYVNGLTDSSVLTVGDELTIPPVAGLIHSVEEGDTLASIAETYDVAEQAIADFNYIIDTSSLALGTELVIPGASVPQPEVIIPSYPTFPNVPVVPSVPAPTGGGWCMWPTTVRLITQYFSWYHNGLDIATPWGQSPPLFACGNGVVTRAGWDPWGLGLVVEIDHGNGFQTTYGHMNRIDVGYGQQVSQGQTIGILGNTGRSTGPHVHFIVKYQGVPQNPLEYIN